jgi:patatin-like phospholipase/acyl hydrolase
MPDKNLHLLTLDGGGARGQILDLLPLTLPSYH